MSQEKEFHVGIKALIENSEGEVLVLHADISYKHRGATESYWDLAGGRIQVGQKPLEALKREIEEETGITEFTTIDLFTAVISNHQIPLADGRKVGLALMIYKVEIPDGSKVTLSREHDEFKWVKKAEAAKLLEHKYPKEFTDLLTK